MTILSDRHAETKTLDNLGVAIHGRSYRNRQETDDLAADYPVPERGLFTIGLLHTNVDGRPGHENYAPCALDALRAKGYDYWALGHVHAHEALSREPWVVYPGCVRGRHVRETGPKGCVLVEVDEARGCVESVELRPLDILRWHVFRIDAHSAATADDVADAALDDIARAVDAADGRLVADFARGREGARPHAVSTLPSTVLTLKEEPMSVTVEHPEHGRVVVPTGFNWVAFLVPGVWALWKRLWSLAASLYVTLLIFIVIDMASGSHGAMTGFLLVVRIVTGRIANGFLIESYLKRGYARVVASDDESVENIVGNNTRKNEKSVA